MNKIFSFSISNKEPRRKQRGISRLPTYEILSGIRLCCKRRGIYQERLKEEPEFLVLALLSMRAGYFLQLSCFSSLSPEDCSVKISVSPDKGQAGSVFHLAAGNMSAYETVAMHVKWPDPDGFIESRVKPRRKAPGI